jgi:hypothetical protein
VPITNYLIRILTEEVHADFMRDHVCIGIGFKGMVLCLAERKSREKAERLSMEDAMSRVRETEDDKVSPSFEW